MVDIFKQINDQVKESKERWKKIEDGYNALAAFRESGRWRTEDATGHIIGLLMLLVEQLRPMSSAGDEAEKIQKEIVDMLKLLDGGK